MKIKLTINQKDSEQEFENNCTLEDVLKDKKINPQTVILMINGKICHPSTKLKENDNVELLGIIYGG